MAEFSDESTAPLTLAQRKALLQLNQVGVSSSSPAQTLAIAKKKPPPPPLPTRTNSATPALGQQLGNVGNTPAPTTHAGKTLQRAPTMQKWEGRDAVSSPSLPARRTSSSNAPALPERRTSTSDQMSLSRKQSMESISSVASGRTSISSYSLRNGNTGSSAERSTSRGRALPPVYNPAELPPLPEKKTEAARPDSGPRVPLRPTLSAPNVQKTNVGPPPLPGRPSLPARTNTASSNNAEVPPVLPSRPKRSILEMGFNNKTTEPPPVPSSRPNGSAGSRLGNTFGSIKDAVSAKMNGVSQQQDSSAHYAPSIPNHDGAGGDGAVLELTSANFGEVVLHSGRPVFVDFYAPYCRYCKELDPVYEQLANTYKGSDLIIAKIDASNDKELSSRYGIKGWPTLLLFDGKGSEPVKFQWTRDLEWMQKFLEQETKIKPGSVASSLYPTPPPSNGSSPPPIPTASRPDLTALKSTKPSVKAALAPATQVCLKCRDFSGPDNHAAKFPRESIPSQDPKWLGPQLCNPFPSPTDKARAIFTWLHHNIDYNVKAFFSNNVQPSTPNSTMATGLAVCEGYAALFVSLATAAGLEAVVVGGHGKGFGFSDLRPGQPLPPRDVSGHAWNAVKIDDGKWKLIDPCWGAGNVSGAGQPYNRAFNPDQFTMSNDEFGERHYPENPRFFYRDDGRPSISWEEYIMFSVGPPKCTVFTPAKTEHGFDEKSFLPKANDIPKNGHEPTIRFQWTKICPHYDIERHHGVPFTFFVLLPSQEQRVAQSDGFYYWIDVRREELPQPGQEVTIQYMDKFKGSDGQWVEGRGLSAEQLRKGMAGQAGWRSWSWSFVARWNVV